MPTICTSQGRMVRVRLTRLDACGNPVEGACSVVTTDGAVSVGVTPTYLDADEIEQVNGAGELCISDRIPPQFKWDELAIVLCNIDPDAWNIITGQALVLDDTAPTPNTVGFRQQANVPVANFALEVWMKVTGAACTDPDEQPFGYWLFPWVTQGTVGEFTFENAALTLTLDAISSGDSPWGTGPDSYLVRRDATAGTLESLLTAIGPEDHMHFERVTAPPPDAVCGCTALPLVP